MNPTTIGPFQIERELGRGGMGVVYLARDTRLDRQVAIKALPDHLVDDPDRLARFQREAKTLASLNHPNIAAIYGLEAHEKHQYLVLEYVEGETLAEVLKRGPIEVDDALVIAKQMAEALEAAHEKGVVHRDIKPGNVIITPEGGAKVLDFGLARTAEGSPSSSSVGINTDSPTLTTPHHPVHSPTIPGAIMGTAGYMSPEQARGKPVDKRSDIFSFGCVLFEMLSGARPFTGETVADALGATLHKELNLALLPPSTPVRVRELLTNCLAKDRKNRLHDIGDARIEIDRALAGREWASASTTHRPGSGVTKVAWGIACAAALLATGWVLSGVLSGPPPAAPAQSYHVSTAVPAKPELSYIVGIAPDARFVVYKAWPEQVADTTAPGGVLVVRRLDRDETKVLDGTEGIIEAALSADGRWIAFGAARDAAQSRVVLKKIALDDGRAVGMPETLCDLPSGGGMSLCWSSEREIIIALAWQQTILAAPAAGGEPRVVVREEQSKEIDNWGEVRPLVPGKSILASRWALVGQTIKERTEVVDLTTGTRTPLLDGAGGTQLVGDGLLVARRNQNTLVAQRFDPDSLQMLGDPVTVWTGKGGTRGFFVSASGTLAMHTASGDITERQLMWMNEQGQPQPVGAPARAYGEIVISPDGGRVAVVLDPLDDAELLTDMWMYDLARRTLTRLPMNAPAWEIVWSRDGQRLAYTVVSKDEFSIWQRRADGSDEPVKVYTTAGPQVLAFPTDWSPDGKTLAILQVDFATNNAEVLMLAQDAASSAWVAHPYLTSPASEEWVRFSPDGKWVRFVSNASGRSELYVQRFTGAPNGAADARTGRVQISTTGANGGGWWSEDGKEIRFVDFDMRVMRVQVQTEPTFSASVPEALYGFKELRTRDFSYAPDGRVMVVLQGEGERPNRINLVVNFLDEVRAKLDAAK
jgi:serine/threonine-protein kinase